MQYRNSKPHHTTRNYSLTDVANEGLRFVGRRLWISLWLTYWLIMSFHGVIISIIFVVRLLRDDHDYVHSKSQVLKPSLSVYIKSRLTNMCFQQFSKSSNFSFSKDVLGQRVAGRKVEREQHAKSTISKFCTLLINVVHIKCRFRSGRLLAVGCHQSTVRCWPSIGICRRELSAYHNVAQFELDSCSVRDANAAGVSWVWRDLYYSVVLSSIIRRAAAFCTSSVMVQQSTAASRLLLQNCSNPFLQDQCADKTSRRHLHLHLPIQAPTLL